jgi:hypothetical protein
MFEKSSVQILNAEDPTGTLVLSNIRGREGEEFDSDIRGLILDTVKPGTAYSLTRLSTLIADQPNFGLTQTTAKRKLQRLFKHAIELNGNVWKLDVIPTKNGVPALGIECKPASPTKNGVPALGIECKPASPTKS